MIIYESEADAIASTVRYIDAKVKVLDGEIDKLPSQRSQVRRRYVERRSAYLDVRYLLTEFKLREGVDREAATPVPVGDGR